MMTTARLSRVMLLAVSLASLASACHAPRERTGECTQAGVELPRVARFARFAITFDVPQRTRAPDDVEIRTEIVAPSGAVTTVGGFAKRGRFESRFAPRELGVHRYSVRADGGAGERTVASGAFLATPGSSAGFVRRSGTGGRGEKSSDALVLDNGERVFLLGENRINVYDPTWNYGNVGIAEYIDRMARAGMTTLRVFVFADAESETNPGGAQPGCLEPHIGRFDEAVAEDFDRIFDAAEASGIYVIMTVYAIGFTPGEETWRSWDDNPYSKARGGPAESPHEFFSSADLRANAVRKLRYVADRYGASPRLLAVDLLNEPEWDGEIPEAVWIPWAQDMSRAWRARDPYDHLVTAGSVGLHWNIGSDERAWYASPENDIVQWHLYGKEYYDPHALAAEMTRKVSETRPFGKPVLCGEFAYGGEPKPAYEHTHAGIWSALLSGAGALAHSAPPFTIDSDEPMTEERARHFRVLSDFLRTLPATRTFEPRADVTVSTPGGRVWSLRAREAGGDARALWLLAPKSAGTGAIDDARVTLPDLPAGGYDVTWIDDVRGDALARARVDAQAGRPTVLAVPRFSRHVAATVLRRP